MSVLFRILNVLYAVCAILYDSAVLIEITGPYREPLMVDAPLLLGLLLGFFLYPTALAYIVAAVIALFKGERFTYTNIVLALFSVVYYALEVIFTKVLYTDFFYSFPLATVIQLLAVFAMVTIPLVALKKHYDHRRSAR